MQDKNGMNIKRIITILNEEPIFVDCEVAKCDEMVYQYKII